MILDAAINIASQLAKEQAVQEALTSKHEQESSMLEKLSSVYSLSTTSFSRSYSSSS